MTHPNKAQKTRVKSNKKKEINKVKYIFGLFIST